WAKIVRVLVRAAFLLIIVVALTAHLAHSGVLWADDTLPLASAIEVWHGHTLYRDVWFDKPPLVSWIYLLWGAREGVPLRVAGAAYTVLCALFAYFAAKAKWFREEGIAAALLTTFFLTFGLPSAVLPLASDMLLIAPHLAAIWCVWAERPYWAGVAVGVGFLASSKAAVVGAVCLLFAWQSGLWIVAGALGPVALAALWMASMGSLGEGWRQAWQWGGIYAANTFVASPVREGLLRTVNFLGFQSAAVAGTAAFLWQEWRERVRWGSWLMLALGGVSLGLRFFPRYYFLLLPALVLGGARGWMTGGRWVRVAMAVLLVIPAARFGPRYVEMYKDGGESWSDLALDQDSKECGRLLRALGLEESRLFVWGFRPEIFVYSGIPAGTRFLESQAISGVLADRHLSQSGAVAEAFTRPNVAELRRRHPLLVVDGIGLLNPELALAKDVRLARWFADYKEVIRTKYTIIYALRQRNSADGSGSRYR
ncbi:MAG: hypothetical protein ABI823_15055, partial [Bryobacteraceae bacterium]